MPKAVTSEKAADKASTNGTGKADQGVDVPRGTDFVDVDEAIAEYKDRKASQLESIKKTDKKVLREMLYQNEFDYLFDSSKFSARFGMQPVSYEEGIRQSVRS